MPATVSQTHRELTGPPTDGGHESGYQYAVRFVEQILELDNYAAVDSERSLPEHQPSMQNVYTAHLEGFDGQNHRADDKIE